MLFCPVSFGQRFALGFGGERQGEQTDQEKGAHGYTGITPLFHVPATAEEIAGQSEAHRQGPNAAK